MKINKNDEWSATFSNVAINQDTLSYILGLGDYLEDHSGGWSLQYTKLVQRRRHHKWRTNKKWAKLYGYKEVPVVISNIGITQKHDGSIDFIGEIEK